MNKFIGGVAVVTLGICTIVMINTNLIMGAMMAFGMFALAFTAIEEG